VLGQVECLVSLIILLKNATYLNQDRLLQIRGGTNYNHVTVTVFFAPKIFDTVYNVYV